MGKTLERVTVLWLLPSSFHLNCQVNVGVVFFSILMYRRTDAIDLSPENPEFRTKMKGINRRQMNEFSPRITPDLADRLQVMGTLQYDYLNRGSWKKIIQSQRFC